MKAMVCMLALASLAPMVQAAEFGRVVSKSEIIRQVPVDHQTCRTEDVTVAPERSAGGAVIGGVAGGVIGHGVGRGSGQAAATVIGAITGAIVGDRIDNRDAEPTTRQVQRCRTETAYQDQVAGYRVTYEYAGKRYTTRMAQDPGDRVAIRVSAVGGEDDGQDNYAPSRYDQPPRYNDDPYRRSSYRR
jgi:uncharacterized protein YcfJ